MTSHFFENTFIRLHYYKYGNGIQHMLCFHGFGMHGKQFKLLEEKLGDRYTFWGFDLLFHKQTKLADESLPTIKKGITKAKLAELITEFCKQQQIDRFSVIGYSMGTHYATALVEELAERIDTYIVAAPSSIEPGKVIRFFSKNRLGNKILEKVILNEKATFGLLNVLLKLHIIDERIRKVLYNEVSTAELRYAMYACLTMLRHLETNANKLIFTLKSRQIKSIFVFGSRDLNYLPAIGKRFFKKYTPTEIVVLDENHELITPIFAQRLAELLI